MLKRVHWLAIYVGSLLLFLLLFLIDMKNEVTGVIQKSQEKIKVMNEVSDNKNKIMDAMNKQAQSLSALDNTLIDTSNIFLYITQVFSVQHVSLNSIQLLKIKIMDAMNILPVKINLTGEWETISKLMLSLITGPKMIEINDFSFQFNNNGEITVQMQLLVFGIHGQSIQIDNVNNKSSNEDFLKNTASINKMKWGGFFHDEQGDLVFLILPNGKAIEAKSGMILGVEKGKVINVKENEININMAGKIVKIQKTEKS